MDIFRFDDYRSYVSARLRNDAESKGQLKRVAEFLGVHSSLVTRVLKGTHHFTPDQAFLLTEYFHLEAFEAEYLISLVNYERAANSRYRKKLKTKLEEIRAEARAILEPSTEDHPLSERNQSVFYSHWYFSAARLLTSIPHFQSPAAIAKHLGLPLPLIEQVVSFLLATGLCIEQNGLLSTGPRNTHIRANSPMLDRHLMNWRMKAMERLPLAGDGGTELFHSRPMVVSSSTRKEIKQALLSVTEEIGELETSGEREELVCLNIDLFSI